MIVVDERTGSRELLQSIRNLGVDAELGGRLAGDFQWTGRGPRGTVLCGVERKTIQDFANSIREKRLEGQQLRPFLETYDVHYIVVEGMWKRDTETGQVATLCNGKGWQLLKGRMKYAEADQYAVWLEEMYGIRMWRTANPDETATYLVDRFRWWSKAWDKHHKPAVYAPAPEIKRTGHRATMSWSEPSLLEKVVAQLPGIDGRAIDVAKCFTSVSDLVACDSGGWLSRCRGLRIGKRTADTIVNELKGKDKR